jgi:hypothetical protein
MISREALPSADSEDNWKPNVQTDSPPPPGQIMTRRISHMPVLRRIPAIEKVASAIYRQRNNANGTNG